MSFREGPVILIKEVKEFYGAWVKSISRIWKKKLRSVAISHL